MYTSLDLRRSLLKLELQKIDKEILGNISPNLFFFLQNNTGITAPSLADIKGIFMGFIQVFNLNKIERYIFKN